MTPICMTKKIRLIALRICYFILGAVVTQIGYEVMLNFSYSFLGVFLIMVSVVSLEIQLYKK